MNNNTINPLDITCYVVHIHGIMTSFTIKAFVWFSMFLIPRVKVFTWKTFTTIPDCKVLISFVFSHCSTLCDGIGSAKQQYSWLNNFPNLNFQAKLFYEEGYVELGNKIVSWTSWTWDQCVTGFHLWISVRFFFFFSCILNSRHHTNGFQTSIAAPFWILVSFFFYEFVSVTYHKTFNRRLQSYRPFMCKIKAFSTRSWVVFPKLLASDFISSDKRVIKAMTSL